MTLLAQNNPLRRVARELRNRAWHIGPWDDQPYATHLPVLVALAAHLRVGTVVEFGAGSFSTPAFLDKVAFPNLERLTSYEDDADWAAKISEKIGPDPRLDLQLVPSVPESVPPQLDADLVFIDDSVSAAIRSRTVASVARSSYRGLVVVHDFQLPELRRTRQLFEHHRICTRFTPQVGLLWQGATVDSNAVDDAVASMSGSRYLPMTEIQQWAQALRGASV